jgi:glycosyltransferase involved in cell wall biosynthesis
MFTRHSPSPTGSAAEESELTPRVTVVIPAREEGDAILSVLERIEESVTLSHEVLVCFDVAEDPTAQTLADYRARHPHVRGILNTYGPGPANAIRYGIAAARGSVVVVTMADGSDDPQQIDDLARLVERGVVVAAASRYAPGGQHVGGPPLKTFLSRMAGLSLHWLCRVGTRDATNSFKAYSAEFLREVGIDSRNGFEIGIELTAKAHRLRLPIAEIPTIWLGRRPYVSRFRVMAWMPHYLHWYWFAFGRRLTAERLRTQIARRQPIEDRTTT